MGIVQLTCGAYEFKKETQNVLDDTDSTDKFQRESAMSPCSAILKDGSNIHPEAKKDPDIKHLANKQIVRATKQANNEDNGLQLVRKTAHATTIQGNFLSKVIFEKVKCLPTFADQSLENQRMLVHELTDHKLLFRRFEHLLLGIDEEIHTAFADHEANFTYSFEVERAHQRAKHGIACICHLPIKLFLSRFQPSAVSASFVTSRLSEVLSEFGALRAGLFVGNIRVEWGPESLIIPQWDDQQLIKEDFVAHIHQDGEWVLAASDYGKKFCLADRERRVEDKIELLLESAEEKRQLVRNLVEIIVKYNCTKQYNLMESNSQHFVADAMHALGIKSIPKFSGPLNDYLQKLKQYRVDIPEEFSDHASLDAYVKPKLEADTLSQHDVEYLLLHYYRLHLNSLPEGVDIDELECEVHSCQYKFLAERVDCAVSPVFEAAYL